MNKQLQEEYLAIIKEELIPAMGCTEPIALAYAAAKGREALGCEPEKITAKCSGNMIKNVRCVTIPNSGGMTGIEAACVLGAVAGDAGCGMEVLEKVDDTGRSRTKELLDRHCCTVEYLDSEIPLHFILTLSAGEHSAEVEVRYSHTNIVAVRKDGEAVFEKSGEYADKGYAADRSGLSLESIKEFADEVSLELIRGTYERQIRYNMDIAYEGISGDYGLGIGRVIRESYADGVVTRMKAYAAAASEARMDGCDMPVIINSGSGNQGIASSVPVIVYAREKIFPLISCTVRWPFPACSPSIRRSLSESCRRSAERFPPPARRQRQLPTLQEERFSRLRQPLTTRWPTFRGLSATEPRYPVRRKSLPVSTPP